MMRLLPAKRLLASAGLRLGAQAQTYNVPAKEDRLTGWEIDRAATETRQQRRQRERLEKKGRA